MVWSRVTRPRLSVFHPTAPPVPAQKQRTEEESEAAEVSELWIAYPVVNLAIEMSLYFPHERQFMDLN